jgi:hypothetical protein
MQLTVKFDMQTCVWQVSHSEQYETRTQFLTIASEYATRKVLVNWEELKLNGTHQKLDNWKEVG